MPHPHYVILVHQTLHYTGLLPTSSHAADGCIGGFFKPGKGDRLRSYECNGAEHWRFANAFWLGIVLVFLGPGPSFLLARPERPPRTPLET